MLDRITAPKYTIIEDIEPLHPEVFELDNGVKVYYFFANEQDCVKFDFVFEAGSYFQNQSYVAYFTNKLLLEGTAKHSAAQISEIFDEKGAFINSEVSKDDASLSFFSLIKHLDSLLPIVTEILTEANFDEKELAQKIEAEKQDFLVDNEKVSTINRKLFLQKLFGNDHPYGRFGLYEEFDAIENSLLKQFYQQHYHAQNMVIFAAGNITKDVLKKLNNTVGKAWSKSAHIELVKKEIPFNKKFIPEKSVVAKEGAIQSSIRIGMPTFTSLHPDFFKLKLLNTVLGGYFGSRLMMNIREDKGYTYGIGSGLQSYKNHGFFVISTEVGVEVAEDAVKEIFFELNRFKNETIPYEELSLVKNYMVGNILRSLDGAFDLAERFKNLYQFGLDLTYYKDYLKTIKTTQSEELKSLAEQYFDEKKLTTLIVGTKE